MFWDEQLIHLFCHVDDFCQLFEPKWNQKLFHVKKRKRNHRMVLSEIMTIAINFHQSGYRTFKKYYTIFIKGIARDFFPNAVSYGRFVELMQEIIFPLFCFLQSQIGLDTGISFIDSTSLSVCNIKRSYSNKTFLGIASKGKTTLGWFFGFKLHIVINDAGELLAWQLSAGNTDDRKPVSTMAQKLKGLLFGDKGYISTRLFQKLYDQGLKLITRLRSNMKNKMMSMSEKVLLRKRGLIESVNDQLKNNAQIEHTRHRSPWNFLTNLIGGLISYTFQKSKPSLNLRVHEREMLEKMAF